MLSFRRHLPPLAFWSVLCALFFATLFVGQERLPSGDFTGQFHAFGLFQARELAAGRFPLWSPYSFAGFPFVADTQAAAFYPPRLLTILLAPSFPLLALEIEVIAHVWLAGLFTYGLAHEVTRRRAAALIAAISFGLGGYLTSYPLLQVALLETVIWLPLVLWLLKRAVSRSASQPISTQSSLLNPRPLILAGLALALSALAGHPQTFLHVGYGAAAYFLFLTLQARWHWRSILKAGLLVAGIGLGAAAIALVPALQFMLNSTRSDVSYNFISFGIPLQDYLQLLLPGTLSFWVPQYAGVLTFALVVVAWLGKRHSSLRHEVMFWGVLAGAAAWLALGDAGILFQAWVKIAPGFSLFRQQERLLGIVALALSLLAAHGWVILTTRDTHQRQALLRKAALSGGGILLLGGLYLLVDPRQEGKPWPLLWLRQWVLLATVLGLLEYGLRRGRFTLITPLLFLVLGVDLYVGTYTSISRQRHAPAAFWPEPGWLQTVRTELSPLARIDSRGLFYANMGHIYGLEDVHGQSPLRPRQRDDFGALPIERRWQLLGVSHVLAFDPPSSELVEVAAVDTSIYPDQTIQARLFKFPHPLPRAWMVYETHHVTNPNAALTILADPAFDPATQVILTEASTPETQPPNIPPHVQVQRQDNRTLRIEVTTETPGFLVISEWDYPGWQATLNGADTPLYTADYALQAIWVPSGTHEIEVRFQPWDVMVGAAATLLTLVIVLFMSTRNLRLTLRQAQGKLIDDLRLAVSRWPLADGTLRPTHHTARATLYAPHLVTALTLLAFLLRLIGAGSQELRGDEAYSFPFIQIPFSEVIPTLAPVGEEHAPLHYLILNLWTKLAGDSELALRFPAIVPGVMAVPLVYQLGKRIRGRSLGLFLSLMLTVSQSAIWLGQDVRNQYVGSILLTGLTTLLFMKAVTASPPRRVTLASILPWLWYALACALTMYTHYYSVFALLAHGLCLVTIPAYRRHVWRWLGAGLVAAALFAPWFLATIKGWAGQLDAPPGDPPQLAAFLVTVGRELTIGPAFGYAWGRWLFLLAFLLCLYGFSLLWRKQRAWAVVLGSWLALTALGVFLVAMRRYIFNNYYIAPATVAWWSLIGVAVLALWQRGGWRRHVAGASVVSLIAAAFISLSHYYGDPITYGRTQGARALAEHIITQYEPGDVFVSNFPDPILPYYLRHSPLPQALQPLTQGEPRQVTEAGLAQLAEQYERIWFLPNPSLWDPEQVAFAWLDYHLLTEQDLTFTNLRLVAYRPEETVNEVVKPIAQMIGAGIVLEGAFLTVDGVRADLSQPVMVKAGSTLALTLVWHAAATIPADYTVFVHLLASDGFLLAQGDGVPLFGTRPTSTWQVEERLLDRHTFTVPENLELTGGQLVVGLYDPVTLERLPAAPDQDAITVGQVDVTR